MNNPSNLSIFHRPLKFLFISLIIVCMSFLHGCTVVKAVDLAASTAIGVTKGAVKVTGAVVDAAIPDGKKKDKKEDQKDNDK